jgi:hypothetical protein
LVALGPLSGILFLIFKEIKTEIIKEEQVIIPVKRKNRYDLIKKK